MDTGFSDDLLFCSQLLKNARENLKRVNISITYARTWDFDDSFAVDIPPRTKIASPTVDWNAMMDEENEKITPSHSKVMNEIDEDNNAVSVEKSVFETSSIRLSNESMETNDETIIPMQQSILSDTSANGSEFMGFNESVIGKEGTSNVTRKRINTSQREKKRATTMQTEVSQTILLSSVQ